MIGAFVLYVGQETLRHTLESIEPQVDYLEIKENVSPVNKAINECFQSARNLDLEHFIIVGADTVHHEGSIKTMLNYMNDDLWCVMGRLEDYYRGTDSYGNHLYHTKNLGDYMVDETDPMYDHRIHADMEKEGFKKVLTKEVIGIHHPVWTVQEAFEKHLHAARRYEEKDSKIYYDQLEKRFNEDPNEVNRASLAGYDIGLETKNKSTTLTNETSEIWEALKSNFDLSYKLCWKHIKYLEV